MEFNYPNNKPYELEPPNDSVVKVTIEIGFPLIAQ